MAPIIAAKGKGGAKGKGKTGASMGKGAHRPRARPGASKPSLPCHNELRRLARRAGVIRIARESYTPMQDLLVSFLANRLATASALASCYKRVTIQVKDVLQALRKSNHPMLWGGPSTSKKK